MFNGFRIAVLQDEKSSGDHLQNNMTYLILLNVGFPGGSEPAANESLLVKNLSTMWEALVWFLVWEDPLEEGIVSQSSILARRIPWTEEPGRLQTMGSQRIGHDWATDSFTTNLHLNMVTTVCFIIFISQLKKIKKEKNRKQAALL